VDITSPHLDIHLYKANNYGLLLPHLVSWFLNSKGSVRQELLYLLQSDIVKELRPVWKVASFESLAKRLASLSPPTPPQFHWISWNCVTLFQINTDECTHILLKHHFINTISLQHISALKQPSSGSMTDTFQQQGQKN
jgi:hypothetical protein